MPERYLKVSGLFSSTARIWIILKGVRNRVHGTWQVEKGYDNGAQIS